MKKFIAILMSMLLVLSMFTTVSASEATEYVTFDLTVSGANGTVFGTLEGAQAIADAAKDEFSNENSASQYIENYLSSPQSKDGGRGVKVLYVLRKDTFESKMAEDGLIYEKNGKEIPFKVSTDLSKKNGLLIGGKYTSAQTLTLNADKNLSTLYIYQVSTATKNVTVKVTYADGHEDEPKSVSFVGNVWQDENIATGLWGPKFGMKYNLTYALSGTKNDAGYDNLDITLSNDADRAAAIAQVALNPGKKVKSVTFTHTDSWTPVVVIGVTGKVATEEEITVVSIEELKTKYASASDVTLSNYEDVKSFLDNLKEEYIPLEDAEYIASLTAAVNGFVAAIDGTVAKYDFIDLSSVKNAQLAANVGDPITVRSFGHTATDTQYVMNVAAINNKKIKGYTFSDNNIPFDVSQANGNYGVRVSNVGEEGVKTIESVTLENPARYSTLSVLGATGTTSERGEIYVKVTYSNNTFDKFTGDKFKSQVAVKNNSATSGITSGDQVSYVGDTNNKDNTFGTLLKDTGKGVYYANTAYSNMYVPVYKFELDSAKEVTSIEIGCSLTWSCFTVLGMTAEKVTLADVIDTLEVTNANYKEIDDMINDLPAGELTSAQQAKLEMLKKHIKFYVQDYVPFEIPESVFNGKVFGSNVPKADATLEDYISVNNAVGNSSILDSVTWEADKKDGLIYSANNIPFNVRTDKGILFGNHSQASVEIDVPDGNYDSISALLAFSYVDNGAFEMRAYYDDGTSTVDSNWSPADFGHYNGNYVNTIASSGKESDSYVVISGGGTLRTTNANPDVYSTFGTKYYFPVMTLDTDVEKTLTKIVLTNNRNNVNGAILGVTGSKRDSTNKVLTRVFNSFMNNFSDAELEAAHEAYVNSYDTGLYTNKTYGLEPMDVIYLKHKDNVLSGKVMSYVNTDNKYSVVALVLNADDSYARVEIMGVGTANLSDHDFSENIVLEEGQKIRVLLWEDFTTLKPYMTAKEL